MKAYLEISITSSPSMREVLIGTLFKLGCRGFEESESELRCYFDVTDRLHDKPRQLEADIRRLLRTLSSNADIRLRTIEDINWNEQWEQTIQPIEVGEKIVIKPSWATYDNIQNRIVIVIDPKMSFGTGFHETTRLMVRLLEKYVAPGCSVLDVGTGTGILAIAAAKLGAARAIGIDVDDWSIANATENVRVNHVADRVTITDRALNELPSEQFDLIAANITLNTIVELLPCMVKRLKQTGVLLLSGLLQSDQSNLMGQLPKRDCQIAETISENEWIAVAVVFHRP